MRVACLVAVASLFAAAPAPAAAQTVDPVGNYTWSFQMPDSSLVKGTLVIVRADSGYHATFTSDHTEGDIPANSVTVKDNHVIVHTEGDFGQFTLDMVAGTTPIQATYRLESNDGPMNGPITVEKVQKAP